MSRADALSPDRHWLAGVLVTSGLAAFFHRAATRGFKRAVVSVAVLFSGAIAPCSVGSALAEPLPKERCAELTAERTLLEGGGAAENLERGPEWAKANLTPEQISYVRRLIAVREDLLFRCQSVELVLDDVAPSWAPANAPVPVRKPAVEQPEKLVPVVPPPKRPERAEMKPPGPPANGNNAIKAGAVAVGAPKPTLRGTLPAGPKATTAAVPAPERKVKPVAVPAAGN